MKLLAAAERNRFSGWFPGGQAQIHDQCGLCTSLFYSKVYHLNATIIVSLSALTLEVGSLPISFVQNTLSLLIVRCISLHLIIFDEIQSSLKCYGTYGKSVYSKP